MKKKLKTISRQRSHAPSGGSVVAGTANDAAGTGGGAQPQTNEERRESAAFPQTVKPSALQTKTTSPTKAVKLPRLGIHPEHQPLMAALYHRAQAHLRKQQKSQPAETGVPKSAAGPERLLHELQVHQIELEMQNAELQKARNELEVSLEKYTDLYDFAPVGYFSLDEAGRINEVNLTGAALLGVERARLLHQSLRRFVVAAGQADFLTFVKKVFAETGKQSCKAPLKKADGGEFWARLIGMPATSLSAPQKCCRIAVWDITSQVRAEAAQQRLEVLAASNLKLRREIIRRQAGEESLRQSEQHQRRLLEQLRQLSRQILSAHEDERKRISRELHDVIAQTLTGINVQLAALAKGAALNTKGLDRSIARTQVLVGKSVEIVHEFARELRPMVLDDLGLIPALHAFVKTFSQRTRIRVELKAFAGVEQLDMARRTVLFRVAQEALTNVARHAKASRVVVSLQKTAAGLTMKVKDDGKSFHVERMLGDTGSKRLGLLGMRERVEMVGGTFGVASAPGHGTTIRVEIPFAAARTGPAKKAGKETKLKSP